MSSDKFVICPQCGAITEKKDAFCGTCGGNVQVQRKEPLESSSPQPLQYSQPQQTQFAQTQAYVESQAESKLKMAWLFAWITVCMGGSLFLILTVYFAIEAKKLGSDDPKIRWSIIIAITGVIIQLVTSILLYVFIYIPFFLGNTF